MSEIYVYSREFELLGIIEEYSSIIWRPSYSDVGDFEIYMGANAEAIELLKENRYIVRSYDISVDAEGIVTMRKVMIVKNATIQTDVDDGDFLTVTGKELKHILHQRLIWSQTVVEGTAENAIRQYVNENAISPSDKKRVIPNLVLGEPANLSDTISKQVTAKPLDEIITEICTTYSYGWDIYVLNKKLVFEMYQGIDRSYNQTDRPYVVFSDEFDNIHNTEYQRNTDNYANTALVGGEGEGLERIYATVGADNSGLDRFETFVDASSVRSNEGNDKVISPSKYLLLLEEQGKDELSKLGVTEAFSGEIINDVSYRYESDYFLGDIVTIINSYGISKNVRVISAIESEDDTGTMLIPQFNI